MRKMTAAKERMKGLLRIGIDFIFPKKAKSLDMGAFSAVDLWRDLPRAPPMQGMLAVLSYRHPITRSMVWQIKYKKDAKAIQHGGYMLSRAFVEHLSAKIGHRHQNERCIIIPIPISTARRRERGYNQCELLAHAMKKHLLDVSANKVGIRTDILIRSLHTERQTLQNRAERLHNMHGVFSVRKARSRSIDSTLYNSSIVILDDVITTGSTTEEARRTLIRAGFKDVSVFALAH